MPLYTLKCKKCGHISEMLCASPDKAGQLKCEKCGKKRLERVFGTFSVGGSEGARSPQSGSTCSASSCKTPS